MLLSAVSVLVVAQSSSEIPEGLMNNPVQLCDLTTLWLVLFFLLFPSVLTRVSPCGISRDIYSVYNLGYYVTMLLCYSVVDSGLVLVGLAACLIWL